MFILLVVVPIFVWYSVNSTVCTPHLPRRRTGGRTPAMPEADTLRIVAVSQAALWILVLVAIPIFSIQRSGLSKHLPLKEETLKNIKVGTSPTLALTLTRAIRTLTLASPRLDSDC